MQPISYRRHQFPPEIIRHGVWLYLRFTLSYRDVEELLAERGLDISDETIRRWVFKFGPIVARNVRRLRPRPSDRRHLDEMVVSIQGRRMDLWRAVNSEGEILDVLMQPKRDKAAPLKLMRKLLKKQGFAPIGLVADKLPSTGPPNGNWASRLAMSRACARTTGRKTRTRCDENGRCKGSSRRGQSSASSPSILPFTTRSTSSAISSPAELSASSGPRRQPNGIKWQSLPDEIDLRLLCCFTSVPVTESSELFLAVGRS